ADDIERSVAWCHMRGLWLYKSGGKAPHSKRFALYAHLFRELDELVA
ncbi:MAG: hypothetical protein QOH21_3674, partial [Acidobacteriota bacterium]|nr:hypothetical protein [Acidobacteriota bacterium]